MARPSAALAAICAVLLSTPLCALAGAPVAPDAVSLLQESVRLQQAQEAPPPRKAREEPRTESVLIEEQALVREVVAGNNVWLPSLTQMMIPSMLVGVALVTAAIICSCRSAKGACCWLTGCCGGSLVVLALLLIAAKLVLSSMAGPAPAGPIPVEPPATSVEVRGVVPFTVAQINAPGPIHEAYKEGMQNALDASGAKRGAVTVLDVEARAANEKVAAPLMISAGVRRNSTPASTPARSLEEQKAPQRPYEDFRGGSPCVDDPTDWKSSSGWGCQDYLKNEWCTPNGGYGSGWGDSWGSFQDYATGNQTASTVCCSCGGGYKSATGRDVYLSYTLERTKNVSLGEAPIPKVTSPEVNKGIRQAAEAISKNPDWHAPGAEPPQSLLDLANGTSTGVTEGELHVAVKAHIRCQAHHTLSSDLQDAARVVLRKKMSSIAKAIEGIASEHNSLDLVLADRCNDPSQVEALRICIGDSDLWIDLVSNGAVGVPPQEESAESYLCKVSCAVERSMVRHKNEAIREANQKVSGLSLDDKTVYGMGCSPMLAQTQKCPPCAA